MDLSADLHMEKLRCAAVHREADADPAGTAPCWDAVMVVEVPLPWPRDISTAEPFVSLEGAGSATIIGGDGRTWRPQGVVPAGRGVRCISFERPVGGGSGPFVRREWCLPGDHGVPDDPDGARALAAALLSGDSEAIAAWDPWRDDPPGETVDLLVCTHGSRDVCCGGPGAQLFAELDRRLAPGTGDRSGAVRLWRTTHTGGHRFAPTCLSFPDGHAWAHLDAETAEQLVHRRGEPAAVARLCRGSLSVDGAAAQVADREALALVGWDWMSVERRAEVVAHDRRTLATTVEVHGIVAGSEMGARVRVELDRHIAKPTCGVVDLPEFTTEPVWKAASVERLGGGLSN